MTSIEIAIGEARIVLHPTPPNDDFVLHPRVSGSERNQSGSVSLDWPADDVLHAATRVLAAIVADDEVMTVIHSDLSHARLTLKAKNGHCGPYCDTLNNAHALNPTCAEFWKRR